MRIYVYTGVLSKLQHVCAEEESSRYVYLASTLANDPPRLPTTPQFLSLSSTRANGPGRRC